MSWKAKARKGHSKSTNPWNNFLKENRGQGKTMDVLRSEYAVRSNPSDQLGNDEENLSEKKDRNAHTDRKATPSAETLEVGVAMDDYEERDEDTADQELLDDTPTEDDELEDMSTEGEEEEGESRFPADGFHFKVLAKCSSSPTFFGRMLVLIQSTRRVPRMIVKFVAYRSNSQGGTWRYCSGIIPGTKTIYKGESYATATLLATRLQYLISTTVQTVVETEEEAILEHVIFVHRNSTGCCERKIPALQPLQQLSCGKVFLSRANNVRNSDLEKLRSTRQYDDDEKKAELSVLERLQTYPRMISQYMASQYMVVDGTNAERYKCSYQLGDVLFRDNSVWTVMLRPKRDDGSYMLELTYMMYHFRGRLYNIPLNLVHSEDTVDWHGMPTRYIDAGLYLCKPIEYKQLCDIGDAVQCEDRAIGREYVFIGDFMHDMWPLADVTKAAATSTHDKNTYCIIS